MATTTDKNKHSVATELPATETLLRALHKSLELNRVLAAYAQFINTTLPMQNLVFSHNEVIFPVLGQHDPDKPHMLRSQLYIGKDYLGELDYDARAELNKEQLDWLKNCEEELLYPLRNALTHRRVRNQTVRDPLTNLGNRVLLEEVLTQLLCVHERSDEQHAVMLIDLDNFKAINDKQGHRHGDAILKEFSVLLHKQLRGCDQVFRYGGDEFLVIIASPEEITLHRVFRRLQIAITENTLLSQHRISCSAGATIVKPAHTFDTLLQEVHQATHKAKENGRDQLVAPQPASLSQLG